MSTSSSFTLTIVPLLLSIGFLIAVGVYSWRHRHVPGAQWFAIACLVGIFWVAGSALEQIAVDPVARLFWVRFKSIWPLFIGTTMFCFILEYANLGHWLTRRNLILLAIPPLLAFVLIFTNDFHHTFWLASTYEQGKLPPPGIMAWAFIAYSSLLFLVDIGVSTWLFIRSPRQRWPVIMIFTGQLITRIAFTLDNLNIHLLSNQETYIYAYAFTTGLFALALFGFRMFDPVPLARTTVIEQMRDGMLVVDTQRIIIDLNPAVERILAIPARRLIGRSIDHFFNEDIFEHACLDLQKAATDPPDHLYRIHPVEIRLGKETNLRYYELYFSLIKDIYGQARGCLILFHDVTEQKQAQEQLLSQQRALAILQERERLARELHDNIGQTLGYVNMQAQAIHKWMQDEEFALAENSLTRLANTAQEAHTDLRESILSLRLYPSAGLGRTEQWSFIKSLRQYLQAYQQNYNIRTDLIFPTALQEDIFEPETGVQLLRVIQEALTNARKHGHACRVQVRFELQDGHVIIWVADDGVGFIPGKLDPTTGGHYGLSFMEERIALIGGSLSIDSQPGAGTRILLQAPVKPARQMSETSTQ